MIKSQLSAMLTFLSAFMLDIRREFVGRPFAPTKYYFQALKNKKK